MFKFSNPIYVAHSGFYLNAQKKIEPLALATVGFLASLDTTTAKFCLYLLLKADSSLITTRVRNSAAIEVRKRNGPTLNSFYRLPTTINTYHRLSATVNTYKRNKPNIKVFIDNC